MDENDDSPITPDKDDSPEDDSLTPASSNGRFQVAKYQCLGKRDKSSAGRIDPHAIDICATINALPQYYTTSSCAGRCFIYQGPGVKATTRFVRYRVCHELVTTPQTYFDLTTLDSDPTGECGDPIRTVGRTEGRITMSPDEEHEAKVAESSDTIINDEPDDNGHNDQGVYWLRFEPFILHVACRSLTAANHLMQAARPAFKNVGLTTWKDKPPKQPKNQQRQGHAKYLVAIWGDEGLEMPLVTPSRDVNFTTAADHAATADNRQWLADLVNERHERNWAKIERFVQSVRERIHSNDDLDTENDNSDGETSPASPKAPRSYDVVGDVALLHSIPTEDLEERRAIGQAIMNKNKAIKIVVRRPNNLAGPERASRELIVLAGAPHRCNNYPLMTSHCEYGIKAVINMHDTFFSPRMGMERLRICQQVARGEHVLVVFAGVAMEALQIAARTEATSVLAIEQNEQAVQCAKRSHQLLHRNKTIKCPGAAERLEIQQGDVMEVLPTLPRNSFDRVVAPRPKEGARDGDLSDELQNGGGGGEEFLRVILPVMKQNGGECHWYDFCADHEYPECQRARRFLERVCQEHNLQVQVLHVANAGSVAMRQLRVCIDFRITPATA